MQEEMCVDSRSVARLFGKRHDQVLRDIQALHCSADFMGSNYEQILYINRQQHLMPYYRMTVQGFLFLTLGYRGKRAGKIKEEYILRPTQFSNWILEYINRYGNIGVDETDADKGNPTTYKWIQHNGVRTLEHRVIWETAYGPLPEGAVIHHKDGDKSNNQLSNLEMFPNSAAHVKFHQQNLEYYSEQYAKFRARRESLKEKP